ncbi:MAG: V-type ATPase 116kDa subunit family protein [Sedimentisphaerales bacterium]|jgi:V/A-type H+-transporting ATPase subunit I|nr:V-type ATPase 116kDa subunit family protein [Sedimentisphaerales bacterium]
MILTTQMTQLFAVVLRRDKERVTEALLREGVMQFISTSEFDIARPDRPLEGPSEASVAELSDLRKRIEGVLHTIGTIPTPPTETDLKNRVTVRLDTETDLLDKLDGERDSIRERQRSLQQEILKLEDIRRQIDLYGVELGGLHTPGRQSMLAMQTGRIPASGVKRFEEMLKDLPALHVALGRQDGSVHYLLLSMKRDQEQIERILAGADWARVDLPSELLSARKDLAKELTEKLQRLTEEQKQLQDRVTTLIRKEEPHLKEVWVKLRIQELCARIQSSFETSSRTVLFAGWLASTTKERLSAKIHEATEGRCYLEWHEADGHEAAAEVPVQFNNPKVLAPFQMLVSNFGIPQYGTIDPTPFVMPLYLIMFGLMFADAGQGLVLAAAGLLGARLTGHNETKRGMHNLFWLIAWCGVSAIVFGVLFGSYFGLALVRPLWFDFHGIVAGHAQTQSVVRDVYDILSITIYFGIAVIAMGLLFNWVNLIRTGQWAELIFDKGGLLGGWIYAGGVYVASYMVHHGYKGFPSGGVLFLLVGLPALLLLIKEPYHHIAHAKGHAEKGPNPIFLVLTFLMQWIVELLEIFSGYLSNTLSFMRVAGLGIAHVCLMMSFFTLAEMTSGLGSVLILLVGNVLVIGLEGLSAAIQALRLNYYEFFTKFFHGTGRLYCPISLSSEP